MEVKVRLPFSPKYPPITPPINAPTKGMGIIIYPTIMPVTVELTEPTATTDALPTCFIFLSELVISSL